MRKQSFLNIIAKYRNFSPQPGSICRMLTSRKRVTWATGLSSATLHPVKKEMALPMHPTCSHTRVLKLVVAPQLVIGRPFPKQS